LFFKVFQQHCAARPSWTASILLHILINHKVTEL